MDQCLKPPYSTPLTVIARNCVGPVRGHCPQDSPPGDRSLGHIRWRRRMTMPTWWILLRIQDRPQLCFASDSISNHLLDRLATCSRILQSCCLLDFSPRMLQAQSRSFGVAKEQAAWGWALMTFYALARGGDVSPMMHVSMFCTGVRPFARMPTPAIPPETI